MREALNQWDYVLAAYSIAVGGTLALTLWSWLSMVSAERRRDESRR
jgi:hypothetical protein